MEKNYVLKDSPLYSTIYSSENIVVKKDLKIKLDNTKKIFSLSHNFYQSKKFNSTFKNYFSYAPPSISNFQENNKVFVFWTRNNSYFILGDVEAKSIISSFNSIASITDQTGGWVCFNLSGQHSKSLFEKLVVFDIDSFKKGEVTRTSINKINCFVLCNEKFLKYTIVCPISFMESMRMRLVNLINLIA